MRIGRGNLGNWWRSLSSLKKKKKNKNAVSILVLILRIVPGSSHGCDYLSTQNIIPPILLNFTFIYFINTVFYFFVIVLIPLEDYSL